MGRVTRGLAVLAATSVACFSLILVGALLIDASWPASDSFAGWSLAVAPYPVLLAAIAGLNFLALRSGLRWVSQLGPQRKTVTSAEASAQGLGLIFPAGS